MNRWAEHRVHCRTGNPILKLTGDIIRAELRQVLYRIRIPLLGPKELGHVLTELAGLLNVHEEITIHRFGILKIDAGPFCSRTVRASKSTSWKLLCGRLKNNNNMRNLILANT